MRPASLLIIVFILLFAVQAMAVISHDEMPIYAVTSDGQGLRAGLIVDIEPGNGKVYTALTSLVGTTTQAAARTAVDVARNYSSEVENYNYLIDIDSPASLVEGPSAGAPMALLVISMLQNRKVPDNVSLTGTITMDGGIGRVGGVFHKAEEASKTGIDLFMIPRGEAQLVQQIEGETQTIDLRRYAAEQWGLTVVEVETIDDVLQYAYSDIAEIEIEEAEEDEGFTLFTPKAVDVPDQLGPMRNLTQKYISDAEAAVEEGKKSLNSSLLEDQALLDALLASLSDSERALGEARLLFERNYFYSAANYAYIAKVNAELVKDVADNPSLLSEDSTVFDMKVQSLKENAEALKAEIEAKVPVDKLEWWISAKQRLSYALNNLEMLASDETIVIDIEGTDNQYARALAELQEYEYASGWYTAAQDLFEITQTSTKYLDARKLNNENAFRQSIQSLIVETENGLTVAGEAQWEDIQRRLDAAKRERNMNWNLTALTDAASALALVNSSLAIESMQDADINSMFSYLEEKINGIDANMEASKHSFIWTQLYLDHARYYQRSALHYFEKGQLLKARGLIENGISLAFLAGHVFIATEEIHTYFDSLDTKEFELVDQAASQPDGAVPPTGDDSFDLTETSDQLVLAMGVLLGALITAFIVVFVMKRYKSTLMHDLGWRLRQNKLTQKQLDDAFAANMISREEYQELSRQCRTEKTQLDQARTEKAVTTLKLDELNNDLMAVSHMLKDLRRRHSQGILTEAQFRQAFGRYQAELERIRKDAAKYKAELKEENLREDRIAKPKVPKKRKSRAKKKPASK